MFEVKFSDWPASSNLTTWLRAFICSDLVAVAPLARLSSMSDLYDAIKEGAYMKATILAEPNSRDEDPDFVGEPFRVVHAKYKDVVRPLQPCHTQTTDPTHHHTTRL